MWINSALISILWSLLAIPASTGYYSCTEVFNIRMLDNRQMLAIIEILNCRLDGWEFFVRKANLKLFRQAVPFCDIAFGGQ